MERTQLSIFSDEMYTSEPGLRLSLRFPRLLICLPLVCPFLPSSITILLLSGKISGLRPDHQRAIRITISISKKRRKNVICQISFVFEKQQKTKYIIYIYINIYYKFSNTEASWKLSVLLSLNMEIPELLKWQCTAVTNVRSLLSDLLFHINLLTKLFLQKLQMHIGCNVEGSVCNEQLNCWPCLWCVIWLASPILATWCTKHS